MAITSLDILNLSHSLKDLCDVNCKQTECLTQTLQFLLEYNLIQANLEFSRQFACPGGFPSAPFTGCICCKGTPAGKRYFGN